MINHANTAIMISGATGSALLAEHVVYMLIAVAVTVTTMIALKEWDSRTD